VKVANIAKLGPILTDAKGMTLYRYTPDQANTSNCYDQCATNWPPLLVTSGQTLAPTGLQGTLGLTTRKDGAKQVTYNGVPLYYFAKDVKTGDTAGQGVGSVWYVVKPGEAAGQPSGSSY
jgi:predicted lipoprotein with Yx(FWY)xxD motif